MVIERNTYEIWTKGEMVDVTLRKRENIINKFVNSDGQWLLSFYKIVSELLSNISSPRSVCCEAATDKNNKK